MNANGEALIDLQVAIADAADDLPSSQSLTLWVTATLAEHASRSGQAAGEVAQEVTIRLIDDRESQTLNRDYRGKDAPTNVLSFPFEPPPGIDLALLGDLVISHDTVHREARQQHKPLADHYAHLVIHGTLHLLGYDHIDDTQADEMEAIERKILAGFAIPDPYAPGDAARDSEDTRPDA